MRLKTRNGSWSHNLISLLHPERPVLSTHVNSHSTPHVSGIHTCLLGARHCQSCLFSLSEAKPLLSEGGNQQLNKETVNKQCQADCDTVEETTGHGAVVPPSHSTRGWRGGWRCTDRDSWSRWLRRVLMGEAGCGGQFHWTWERIQQRGRFLTRQVKGLGTEDWETRGVRVWTALPTARQEVVCFQARWGAGPGVTSPHGTTSKTTHTCFQELLTVIKTNQPMEKRQLGDKPARFKGFWQRHRGSAMEKRESFWHVGLEERHAHVGEKKEFCFVPHTLQKLA